LSSSRTSRFEKRRIIRHLGAKPPRALAPVILL
jgi:hypothetical protein